MLILVPNHFRSKQSSARRGSILIYVMIAMVVFIGFASLAVDVGHARLVKVQLQHAADAAAHYAARGMQYDFSTAQSYAIAAAGDNTADGTRVSLSTTDVEGGTWDGASKTFTPLPSGSTSQSTAIRVTARRTVGDNNPVQLTFGAILGQRTCDVQAVSIVAISPGYGAVGMGTISLGGNSSVVAYSSATGLSSPNGSMASNGDISVSGSGSVQGAAHPGPGETISVKGAGSVSGSTTSLGSSLSYPMPSAGSASTSNSNAQVPLSDIDSSRNVSIGAHSTVTLPGGTYYFNDFSLGNQATLNFLGPATVYVTDNFSPDGTINPYNGLAQNLTISMTAASSAISLGSKTNVTAQIYAPGSDLSGNGGDMYGSIIAHDISLSGNATLHLDVSIPSLSKPTLVQ